MSRFIKGEEVVIRDYPFGRPLNIEGTVVGILDDDHYNVKINTGLSEGKIITFKYWKIERKEKIVFE
jgi:hypothetical protein|tara:strand:- start:40 stop:240 length:201 start_codon:yes stop_codon:yes gene_type:complete